MSEIFYTADCETDPFKEGRTNIAPFIWGLYGESTYREFDTTDEFISHVKELDIIVYAHNGGKFDWFFTLRFLPSFEELLVINGRLSRFKIGRCEFRDSYNILPIPLAEYQKDEVDYAIFEKGVRDIPANKKIISDYLRSDCVYLYNIVDEFRRTYGNGLTLAGCAMKYFKKLTGIKIEPSSAAFYSELSQYYYGGRVEAFEVGVFDDEFKVIDINSAYPHAMMSQHPFGLEYSYLNELPKTDAYISRAFIRCYARSTGAFPYRAATGALSFPNDKIVREFFITGHEFLAARDVGELFEFELISCCVFNDSISFDDYVNHFYEMKENSEKGSPEYIFAKLFLNSLYGKFGANPENYKKYMAVSAHRIDAAADDGYEFSAMLPQSDLALMQADLGEEEQRFFNVAVAASITGAVRAKLYRALRQCEGVVYCDTDSIVCRKVGAIELDPKKLGAWDVEADCDMAAIAGKKLYALRKIDGDYKIASKGARLTPDELIRVANGETVRYTPIAPTFSLKRGITIISRDIKKIVDSNKN